MARWLSLPLVLALAACAVAPRQQADAGIAVDTNARASAAVSVELHSPRPGLYSAAQPAAGDWAGIAARGVGTVINLRTAGEMGGRDEAAEVRAAGMRYLELPVDGAAGITAQNARKLAQMLSGTEGAVLVHCASANRSGGLLALMAAQEEGLDEAQALAFGREAGMRSTVERVRAVLACTRTGEDGLPSC